MRVFDIKRSSLNDGDGIRTVVFFKSCPLRCIWCHNPEGFTDKTNTAFYSEKCICCGKCAEVCKSGAHVFKEKTHTFDPKICMNCGKCVSVCPTSAMLSFGYDADAVSLCGELLRDAEYFRFSGGGVTFSGGEPMAQPDDAIKLAQALKSNGISVYMETSGYGDPDSFRRISGYIDTFLFDVKQIPPLYIKYTGVHGARIFRNLRMLDSLGADIVLRCPIIPGVNLKHSHFSYIASLAKELRGVREVDLMPYHPAGIRKYGALGIPCKYEKKDFLEKSALEAAREKIEKLSGKPCRTD